VLISWTNKTLSTLLMPLLLLPTVAAATAAGCSYQRAMERVGHEGGVDGKAAPRVVNGMATQLKKAGGR
jgi:hypothetical protein